MQIRYRCSKQIVSLIRLPFDLVLGFRLGGVRMHHAKRMDSVLGPATVKMMNIVSSLRAQGIDIISFSMGEPDFATPKHISEAAAAALLGGFTHYTPSAGIPELLDAIAEKSKLENGIQCTPKDIIVTPAKLAIFGSIFSQINEGDEVIIPDPAWVSYEPIVRFAGGIPVLAKTTYEDEFRLKPEIVAKLVTNKTNMIIINSPSNPTGAVMTKDDIKGIADIAKDHDL
ncbi:MAG: aminotransferase class I/II-fold pyridoxal phosphate-dependent enzyme, partial [Thermoplasmata archaeon]